MKKSIYLGVIALATLSMTSCSKDDVVESVPQQHAIEFGTYLGHDVQSRGVELNNNNFNEFGVFAFYTGQTTWQNYAATATPNFMYNQSVNRTAKTDPDTGWDDWTYSPKKYWPTTKNDKITFFAYAPMAYDETDEDDNGISVSANTANGTPVVTYEITNDNLDNLGDFVADALIDETRTGGDGNDIDDESKTVSFTLLHELTRVGIKAKLSADAYDDTATDAANKTIVNIKSIKFIPADEFCNKADYTFASKNDSEAVSPTTEVRGTWSNFSNENNEALDIANLLNVSTTHDYGNYKTHGVILMNTTAVNIFKTSEYLFLIPHGGLSGISAGGKVKMEVAYDIVTVDSKLSAGHSVTPATKIIELPKGLLKQGTAYTLTLIFGLNEIILEASVDSWVTDTDDANVDWPKTDKTN